MATKDKQVHVVYRDDKWQVTKPTQSAPVSNHRRQDTAIDSGRSEAKRINGELYIHRKDGPIRDRDSYGRDPNPPKDTVH